MCFVFFGFEPYGVNGEGVWGFVEFWERRVPGFMITARFQFREDEKDPLTTAGFKV